MELEFGEKNSKRSRGAGVQIKLALACESGEIEKLARKPEKFPIICMLVLCGKGSGVLFMLKDT